jgi:hypothetical protein
MTFLKAGRETGELNFILNYKVDPGALDEE